MRWILWIGRMLLAMGMMAALVIKPDPRLFFGIGTLWITTREIMEFCTEARRQRVKRWEPGTHRRQREW